jgi:hypothetical protein
MGTQTFPPLVSALSLVLKKVEGFRVLLLDGLLPFSDLMYLKTREHLNIGSKADVTLLSLHAKYSNRS